MKFLSVHTLFLTGAIAAPIKIEETAFDENSSLNDSAQKRRLQSTVIQGCQDLGIATNNPTAFLRIQLSNTP